jgi:class 3 adenylate cyclase
MILFKRLSIQSKLILMLLTVCITSIIAVGWISYQSAKKTLTDSVFSHLITLRASRAAQIEAEMNLVRKQVSQMSEDRMVVIFTRQLRDAWGKLQDVKVTPEMDRSLRNFYQNSFLPGLAKNTHTEPILDAYLPAAPAERYLQYQYIANNPNSPGMLYMLDDALDGSDFSAVHRQYQPILRRFIIDFNYDNFYLLDSDTGEIIYNCTKTPAFATNALNGPYSDSGIGELFKSLHKCKDKGAIQVVDFGHIAAAQGKPQALLGCPIFDGVNEIGIVALIMPTDEINRVTTGDLGWQRDGLGDTGEVYLVGSDGLMRSKSRLLLEDRDRYFAEMQATGHSPEEIAAVKTWGSILAQPVRTPAVDEALAGREGTAIMTNYRGVPALTSYAPLNIQGLRWVIVAEIQADEAFAPLDALTRKILYSSVVMILLVTLAAGILAGFFVRPIYKLVDGVKRLSAGETDVSLEIHSKDEFMDLAAAFNQMAHSIKAKNEELARRQKENHDLLLNMLPPTAVSQYTKGGERTPETHAEASMLFANILGMFETARSLSPERAFALQNDLIEFIDDAAERHGVERIWAMGGCYVAACGMSVQRIDHASRIADFAQEIVKTLRRFNQDRGVNLSVRIGISAGTISAGIIGRSRFAYDVWGATVETARRLSRVAGSDYPILMAKEAHDLVEHVVQFAPPVQFRVAAGGPTTVAWPLANGQVPERPSSAPSAPPKAPPPESVVSRS